MAMVLFGMSEQAGQHLLLAGSTIFFINHQLTTSLLINKSFAVGCLVTRALSHCLSSEDRISDNDQVTE